MAGGEEGGVQLLSKSSCGLLCNFQGCWIWIVALTARAADASDWLVTCSTQILVIPTVCVCQVAFPKELMTHWRNVFHFKRPNVLFSRDMSCFHLPFMFFVMKMSWFSEETYLWYILNRRHLWVNFRECDWVVDTERPPPPSPGQLDAQVVC